jgi:branched-chain amino acid transport system substrate-binding protein
MPSKRKWILALAVFGLMAAACAQPAGEGTTTTAGPVATTVATTTPTETTPAGGTLKIISSFPLTGASLTQTETIVNSIKLGLRQRNNAVCSGAYTVEFESLDDASAATGRWDAAIEQENATKAVSDPAVIAYLGTWNSGAAKVSIPILGDANLVMVSPANTYPGLTKENGADLSIGEPGVYYPSGVRNYARVVAADDIQGAVGAKWAQDLGAVNVYVLDDAQLYGKGVADVFDKTATDLGLVVVGHESIDVAAPDYQALMTKISTSNAGGPPDLIYLGMVVDSNAAQLIKDKVSVMGDNTGVLLMSPDGLQTQATIDGAGADVAEGMYSTVAGLPVDLLPQKAQDYRAQYEAEYGPTNEPYAVYGYETISVVLDAIEGVCAAGGDPTDRATVRDAVFATKDYDGVLGTWSFDANGDTSLTDMTSYQVQGGVFVTLGVLTG